MEVKEIDGMKTSITAILAAALVLTLTACNSIEAASMDGKWYLSNYGGQTVSRTANTPFFVIDGNTITGFDGCNQFGGKLDDPNSLRVGQRACAGDYIKIPIDLSNAQNQLSNATLDGDLLTVPATGPFPASEFVREK